LRWSPQGVTGLGSTEKYGSAFEKHNRVSSISQPWSTTSHYQHLPWNSRRASQFTNECWAVTEALSVDYSSTHHRPFPPCPTASAHGKLGQWSLQKVLLGSTLYPNPKVSVIYLLSIRQNPSILPLVHIARLLEAKAEPPTGTIRDHKALQLCSIKATSTQGASATMSPLHKSAPLPQIPMPTAPKAGTKRRRPTAR